MPVRTALAVLAIFVSSLAAYGQSCPTAPPSPAISINSECASQAGLCDPSLPVSFEIIQPLQSCDVVTWSFGDGTTEVVSGNTPVTHTYRTAGVFTVRAEVRNALGSSSGERTVSVGRGFFYIDPNLIIANEADGLARVTIVRTSRAGNANVTLTVTDGTARNGIDYKSGRTIVVPFVSGQNSRTISIPLINDNRFDGDTQFSVQLSAPTNLYLLHPEANRTRAAITIIDDEVPTISFQQSEVTVKENAGTVSVVIHRTGDLGRTSTVDYQVFSSLSELTPASGTLTFAPDETSKTLVLTLANDAIDNGDRVATLTLRNPSRNTVFEGREPSLELDIRILEDDRPPSPIVQNGAVFEGRTGTTPMTFAVSLPASALSPATLRIRTVADAEAEPHRDFEPLDTTITMNPGEPPRSIVVTVYGDRFFEDDESFQLLVEPNAGSGLVSTTSRGTIRNDDAMFDPPSVHVPRGSVVTARLIFGPFEEDEGNVSLVSADPSIATVPSSVPYAGPDGFVEIDVFGVRAGITNVRATFSSSTGGATADLLVIVYDVASLSFETDSVRVEAGNTVLAKLTMLPAPGIPLTVPLTSSDQDVARVPAVIVIAPDGTATVPITAVGDGTAVISATLPELFGATFATIEVQVGEIEPPRRRAVRK
jgi:PKD repeat protein